MYVTVHSLEDKLYTVECYGLIDTLCKMNVPIS